MSSPLQTIRVSISLYDKLGKLIKRTNPEVGDMSVAYQLGRKLKKEFDAHSHTVIQLADNAE